jgi:hypothetical protein
VGARVAGRMGRVLLELGGNNAIIVDEFANLDLAIPAIVFGSVENENNIWMHPPRDKYFRILELNPFPFIKAPYEIGNAWDWTLIVGSGWGDHRWKLWEGHLENQCKYVIKDKINLKTKLGEIECLVIESTASSSVGNTKLTSYFNAEFGFVKLDYLNIDGSKTKLELVEHSRKQNGR